MRLFAFCNTLFQRYLNNVTLFSLSSILALYTTVILNASVWINQINTLTHFFSTETLTLLYTFLCISSFTVLLLWLSSLLGITVYRIIISFFLLCSATAAYYMTFFHVVIGYGVIISIFTTELELSREVIGWKLLLWLIVTAIIPIIFVWRIRLTQSIYRAFCLTTKRLQHIACLCLLIVCVVFPLNQLKSIQEQADQDQQMPSTAGVLAHRYLPTNWIAGLGMVVYHYYAEAKASKNLFIPTDHFSYVLDPDSEDLTVIFVIGETTRSDHMHILGYDRETTPLLEQEKNLIAFKGQSCDTATALSLRCMFVRSGGTSDDESRQLKELNVFASLKKLGFSSELFAMQGEAWFYNSLNTDNYMLREMVIAAKGNEGKPMDDMLLLPPLMASLANHPNGKHLIVLHTKGSHHSYAQRYPRSFAFFKPECLHIDDSCTVEQNINAFDNSVRYVDLFLSQVIQTVKHKKAIVFYSSDHGESIEEKQQFHATPLKIAPPEQRRIPVIIWMSDAYLHTPFGKKAFTQLAHRQHTGTKVKHEELFDSILGCIGFTSADGGINPQNNWCYSSENE